jgi:hypothetical protein
MTSIRRVRLPNGYECWEEVCEFGSSETQCSYTYLSRLHPRREYFPKGLKKGYWGNVIGAQVVLDPQERRKKSLPPAAEVDLKEIEEFLFRIDVIADEEETDVGFHLRRAVIWLLQRERERILLRKRK